MNNGNKQPGNAELIAIANRRREEMKKAQAAQKPTPSPQPAQPKPQPAPQPRPSQSAPNPQHQPKPQPKVEPKKAPAKRVPTAEEKAAAEKRRKEAEAIRKRKEEEEKKRAAEAKRKKEAEERERRDREAAEKRIARREKADEALQKIASLRETYKGTLKSAFAYFIIFLCVLLIICTISATVFLLSLMNYGERDDAPSEVVFNAGGQDQKYDYSEIVRDGVYYLNFSAVAKLCDFSLSGDSETVIYSTASGEQIKFTPPSRTVLVNGNSVSAQSEILFAQHTEREVWVPIDFVRDYIIGIEVSVDEGINEKTGDPYLTVRVSRIPEGDSFAAIGFLLKYNSTLSGISNESLPEEPVTLPADAPTYEFAADLSYYLRFMCPEDYEKHMVLINPSNPADETYIPEDMITVPNPRYDNGASLCRDASMSLEALFLEMYTLGFREMKVSIAYRSYEQQKYQFEVYTYNERYYYRSHYETEGKWFSDEAYAVLGKTYLEEKYISQGKTSLSAEDAKRVAMSYSAYPGTGDHQTGLALDLYLPGYTGQKFAESEEYTWLLENAHKFGFIFRYPEDKENITGYSFEPQHLRFVGQYHAALIYETGLSLEEYVAKYID